MAWGIRLGKKLSLTAFAFIYMLYGYAIITNNNFIGDLLSPVITLILAGFILYGFGWKTGTKIISWPGCFLFLAVSIWAFCDVWWAIQSMGFHTNPEDSFLSVYGYSLTNIFLFLAVLIEGYRDIKQMNKIQAMLDAVIVFICMTVLLWLFVFEQRNEKAAILYSDGISFLSIMIDVLIYVWINVWGFSTRQLKPPAFQRMLVVGGLTFVITDLIYYYVYFYTTYEPNSWIDGAYMLSFSLMAIAAYMKKKTKTDLFVKPMDGLITGKARMELLVLLVPLVVFIWKRDQIHYMLLLVAALMIYYVLINYTQKSIFQKTLLDLEKKNVSDLEQKILERTEEIVRTQNTDYLSGLYSRRYFDEKLSNVIQNIGKEEKIALLYIDQNKSRSIRYLFGKGIAEHLLKEVAESVRSQVERM